MPVLPLLLLAATFEPTGGVALSCQENLRGKIGRARVEVVIGAGALHEGETERGVAHLLEHLVLRPLGFDDGNGATGWDYTQYHRNVNAEQLVPAASELLQQLRTPKLNAEDVALEKRIVLRELEDSGTSHVETHDDPVFGSSSLARSPGGSAASVRDLDPDAVARFHSGHYVRGNIAVLLRGAVDCSAARAALAPILSEFSNGPASEVPKINNQEPGQVTLPSTPGNFVAGFYWYNASMQQELLYRLVAKHLEQQAIDELRKKRGLTYSPQARFLRRGPGGQILLQVQTSSGDSEVQEWYDASLQALLTTPEPHKALSAAIPELRKMLEQDGVRAGLAQIRGEPSPFKVLQSLNDTNLRTALPPLLSSRRAFGSAVPQSNVGSLLILGLFGLLVLGALFYAYREFLGR